MKKLTRKLFLSVAALACCAATLVSTTFAWYVNNPTAYAKGATGSTANVDTSGSLSISKTGAANTWFKEISLTDVTGSLNPVHTTDGLAFTSLAGEADGEGKIGSTVANSTDQITITLYLKADAAGTVDLDLETVNATLAANYKSQVAYNDNAPVTVGQSFMKDAADAMYISRTVYTGTDYATAGTTAINTLKAESDTYSNTAAAASEVTLAEGGDANAYYEAVKEETLTTDAKTAPTTAAMAPIELTANTPVKVVYKIWLEGADTDCFNACTNQNFTFELTYNYTKNA